MSALPLVDRLLASLTSSGLVVDVRIGTHWTAVVVSRSSASAPGWPQRRWCTIWSTDGLRFGKPAS